MPEQPSTLAARIRAKYPGVYDDIADGELEQRVSAKFPGVYDDVPRTEAPLTRERQPTGAPSALAAGHHPDTMSREVFGKRVPMSLEDMETPSDAAFLKRAPEIGGAAGMIAAGPLGAGAGAAAGSLVRDQAARGPHMPTGGEMGSAALEGGKTLALSAIPGLGRVAAERIGPALVRNAEPISNAARAVAGGGFGGAVLSGSVPAMLKTGAAAVLADPRIIRTVGNAATAVGNAPMHAVNKTGMGLLSAEAFRKALLDALEAESPASAVP